MSFMGIKLRHRDAGELELGFVDRIAFDFPDVRDGVMRRLRRYRVRRLG